MRASGSRFEVWRTSPQMVIRPGNQRSDRLPPPYGIDDLPGRSYPAQTAKLSRLPYRPCIACLATGWYLPILSVTAGTRVRPDARLAVADPSISRCTPPSRIPPARGPPEPPAGRQTRPGRPANRAWRDHRQRRPRRRPTGCFQRRGHFWGKEHLAEVELQQGEVGERDPTVSGEVPVEPVDPGIAEA